MHKSIGLDSNIWYSMCLYRVGPMKNDTMYSVHSPPQNFPRTLTATLPHTIVNRFGGGKHPFIQVPRREECKDMDHLEKFLQDVLDVGGEGIILRDPKAPYQPGRSPGYLKHKVSKYSPSLILPGLIFWFLEI